MTLKIFRNAFMIGIVVLLLCSILFFSVLYGYYESMVYAELAIEADYVVAGVESASYDYLEGLESNARVTWVSDTGEVLYDSAADINAMENHLDREEIVEALKSGEGRGKHRSNTLMEETIYFARALSDGTVIRVSTTHGSVAAILLGMAQPILWIIILILLLSAFLSSRLARQITKPINALNLEDPSSNNPYEELNPLVSRVREQNRTIRLQMDALSKRQREFVALSENMREGFLLVDRKRMVLSGNKSGVCALFGEDNVHKRVVTRLNCGEEICTAVDAALAGERTELMLEREERTLQLIASPVIDNTQVSGAVLMIIDVTEYEQRERMRREFSANVSHELKTPLTSISGFAELMKEGMVAPEKMLEFSNDIYRESRRLLTLVEDIIRLSKLDEGTSVFENEPVDLYMLCSDVLQELKPSAQERRISLEIDGEALSINGNWRILYEMIFNLCDNAVKYNVEEGRVKLKLWREAEGICLSVSDTGIGIPSAYHERIFERFYCVDKSHSKSIGGTGLGLSIVRHGAKYHDASVSLKSIPGKGSTFTIVFPLKGVL